MGKVTNMILFLSVIVLLYHFAGLIDGTTPISLLIGMLRHPENLRLSTLYDEIAAALALVTGIGVVIGLFAAQRVALAIKASFVSFLILIGWDFLVVFQKISEVNYALATLTISPFLITFLIAVIEWWGGHD